MVAASLVMFSHAYALTGHTGEEPLVRLSGGRTDAATVGVVVFFGISGFLIAQSLRASPSLVRYAIARALRIVPGLFVAKLFCVAVIGWLATTLSASVYWTHPDTWRFLLFSPFFGVRDHLPGVFTALTYPLAVNGSLWTIPVEVWCYGAAALLAVVALTERPWLCTALFAFVLAGYAFFPEAIKPLMPSAGYGTVPGLLLSFFFGCWLQVCRRTIPVSLTLAAIVALLVVAGLSVPRLDQVLYYAGIPYVALVVAYHPRLLWRRYLAVGDYSYGTYVLAFPVQQLLIWRLGNTHPLAHFAFVLAATLPLAMLSWHFVEAPALALKTKIAAFRLLPHAAARSRQRTQGS